MGAKMQKISTKDELILALNENRAEFITDELISRRVMAILPIKDMGVLKSYFLYFSCFFIPFDGCSGCHCVDKLRSKKMCENQSNKIFCFEKKMLYATEFFGFKNTLKMAKNYQITQSGSEFIFRLIKR